MKNILFRRYAGFSLAEAMITILIIGIIALLSVPIAKKIEKKQDQLHGKWICTINKAGQHVMWQKGFPGDSSNPETWQATGNSCTFNAPLKARNFSIQAIGGGGGGAAGVSGLDVKTDSFNVKNYGIYRMVAVGAGGAGGMSECDLYYFDVTQMRQEMNDWFGRAGGGGGGGVGYATVEIGPETYQIQMQKGNAVNNTSDKWGGSKGGDSYIKRLYSGGSKYIIYATGGEGGQPLQNICSEYYKDRRKEKKTAGYGGANGTAKFEDSTNIYKAKGTYADTKSRDRCRGYMTNGSYANCYGYNHSLSMANRYLSGTQNYQQFINTSMDVLPGRGGNTGATNNRCEYGHNCGGGTYSSHRGTMTRSNEGFVIAVTDLIMAGGAGKTAQRTNGQEFYPSFPSKQLIVTIGKGGAGGVADSASGTTVDENTSINGEKGGSTIIGNNWLIFEGGEGGTSQSVVAGKSSPGGNGEKTPIVMRNAPDIALGGLSDKNGNLNTSLSVDGQTALGFGTGGGGGGVLVSDDEIITGNGGNGAPGYVIIEW